MAFTLNTWQSKKKTNSSEPWRQPRHPLSDWRKGFSRNITLKHWYRITLVYFKTSLTRMWHTLRFKLLLTCTQSNKYAPPALQAKQGQMWMRNVVFVFLCALVWSWHHTSLDSSGQTISLTDYLKMIVECTLFLKISPFPPFLSLCNTGLAHPFRLHVDIEVWS